MATYVLVYDGFAQFEVILTCLLMKRKGDIITVSIDEHEVKSIEGFFINKNVVIDGNIITAKPCGYIDFALEVSEKMGIYENDSQIQETIDFFKFYKDESN